ncbi:TMEM175 family protein [Tateyamaria sp. ANG-S1]|uniref:TMEM175 family protein n=1 Tax=Tateyamaria sp. ANG-S1 TaxID=1577905 RepID=UPI00057F1F23|nr:TMEM175 family protein [Tateyamaria sp. ANG-S1]KIC51361.1 hypothetical protein RA29_05955 [Tateyamaria sp. ANG-S1]
MKTSRLEALSDGVIAIIITIMVLQFEVPDAPTLGALFGLMPTFLSYAISCVFVGIYWHNHHVLLHSVERVSASQLWLNLNFLFWLSLLPFATAWMDKHVFSSVPVALYGSVMSLCSVAYVLLRQAVFRNAAGRKSPHLDRSKTKALVGSMSLQSLGVLLAVVAPVPAIVVYVASLGPWLFPDRAAPGVYRGQG